MGSTGITKGEAACETEPEARLLLAHVGDSSILHAILVERCVDGAYPKPIHDHSGDIVLRTRGRAQKQKQPMRCGETEMSTTHDIEASRKGVALHRDLIDRRRAVASMAGFIIR